MLEMGQEIACFAGLDTVTGIDSEGRPVYRFGERRADGVWISPRARCEPQVTHVRSRWSRIARTPMYLYGDDLKVRLS